MMRMPTRRKAVPITWSDTSWHANRRDLESHPAAGSAALRAVTGRDCSDRYAALGGTIAIFPAIVLFSIRCCAWANSLSGSTFPTTGLI